nr:hypothetical protein [uncultured Carboxylicivirga sp.]
MKNLNDLGVQEMDAMKMKNSNGGFNDRPYRKPSGSSQFEIDAARKEREDDSSWAWWFLLFSKATSN